MSLANGPTNPVGGLRRSFDRHPLAREIAVAIVAVGVFALLYETLRDPLWGIIRLLPTAGGPVPTLLVQGGNCPRPAVRFPRCSSRVVSPRSRSSPSCSQ